MLTQKGTGCERVARKSECGRTRIQTVAAGVVEIAHVLVEETEIVLPCSAMTRAEGKGGDTEEASRRDRDTGAQALVVVRAAAATEVLQVNRASARGR